jgi:hypothetical protein
MVGIMFQKNKVRAVPTPKFIKAIQSGNLTYENSIPDGCSITQLPQSLQGTELEQIDMARLLNMDENGTISENDTLTLNKSVLPISRTMHYLQDKAHAWEVFCKTYFGDISWTYLSAQTWKQWIDDNFSKLQEIRASRDRDLPVKLELSISDRFNRILRALMISPPDEALFDDSSKEGIINRTTYLEIPTAIQDMINKAGNHRRNNDTPAANKRNKASTIRINHENQPLELQMSSDQYLSKAIPYIQSHKDKLPKFDNTTDECIKYALLGYCNNDCPRKKSHTKFSRGTSRFDKLNKLNKLKQAINNYNHTPDINTTKQDFHQGEAS